MKKVNKALVSELENVAKKVYSGDPNSRRRLRVNVDARVAIFTQLKPLYTHSDIGRYYGVTHSTIGHLLIKHQYHLKTNSNYKNQFERFEWYINEPEQKKALKLIHYRQELHQIATELLWDVGLEPLEIQSFFIDVLT